MTAECLHITNGDSAAGLLRASGVGGDVLPWRDVLHEGPVPGGLSLARLSQLRADYLVGAYTQLDAAVVRRDFRRRNLALRRCSRYRQVILWFEHDLYDQLQLLQLLDWLAAHPPRHTRLSLICTDRFEGVQPFYGLGQLSPAQIGGLAAHQRPLGRTQLSLGAAGWRAFTAPDPMGLEDYRARADLDELGFMRAAITRWLQEFPSCHNGLARSLQQILELVAAGEGRPGRLFAAHQRREEAPYLGDWSFWRCLGSLCDGARPLLASDRPGGFRAPAADPPDSAFLAQHLALTATGAAVLGGNCDWTRIRAPDQWLGGVHLRTPDPPWRWDREQGRLCPVR